MSFIKEKWNMICMALYGVSALCLLFPAFSVGAYGFSLGINAFSLLFGESFWALLLFLVPIGGLVFSIVTRAQKNYLYHMILFIVGIVLIFVAKGLVGGSYSSFISLGMGSILTIICYVVGGLVYFLNMGNK